MAKRKTQKSTDTQVSAAAETATTVTVPVASEPAPDTSAAVSPASDDSAALSSQPEGGAYSRFSDFDIYLFRSGKHARLYEKFGSHVIDHQGVVGTYFAVWAPSAKYVAVIGNFNGWNKGAHAMGVRWDGSGIWEIFIPHIGRGEVYKYFIVHESGRELEKGDPYAHTWEVPPLTASMVWDNWHEWTDQEWMQTRQEKNALTAPFSVYEVHLSSWRRDPSDPERELSYGEIADALVPYVQDMGFTHVEVMPVVQYPWSPAWWYEVAG